MPFCWFSEHVGNVNNLTVRIPQQYGCLDSTRGQNDNECLCALISYALQDS